METRQQNTLLVSINSKAGTKAPKITPVPMPETALQRLAEKAKTERRLSRHNSLVRRLLGDRAKQE